MNDSTRRGARWRPPSRTSVGSWTWSTPGLGASALRGADRTVTRQAAIMMGATAIMMWAGTAWQEQ